MSESLTIEIDKLRELTAAKTKAPLIARIAATTWAKSNPAAFELLIGLLLRETEADSIYWEPSDSEVSQVIEIASEIFRVIRDGLKRPNVYQRALLGLQSTDEVDPDWITEAAKQIYGSMDEVLENRLGYNVNDAIRFSKILIEVVIHVAERIRATQRDGDSPQKLWRCFYLFPHATAQKYGLDEKKFLSYVNSLTCAFGEDYGSVEEILSERPLRTKPFIRVGQLDDDEIILCPIPALLAFTLPEQIECSLMERCEEQQSILERLQKEKSLFLERSTMSALSSLLQTDEVYRRLHYPDPRYNDGRRTELDGLCVFDTNLIPVECKAGSYRPKAKIGSIPKLKTDLKKTIEDAFEQAKRAREYVRNVDNPVFYLSADRSDNSIAVKLDRSRIKNIYLVTSTLSHFAGITTSLSGLRSIGLFSENEFPWSVCVGDLAIIKEFFDSPLQFIHYLRLRLDAEYKSYVAFTELAFLGAYKDNFLTNIDYQYDTGAITHVLFKFEEDIMRQLRRKREGGKDCILRRDLPPLFQNIIKTLETLRPHGFVDIGIALLEMPSASLQELAVKIQEVKNASAVRAKDLHSETVFNLKTGVGISYIIAGEQVDTELMRAALYLDYDSSDYQGRISKWISLVERKGDRFPISMAAAIEPKAH
jgi:hypothetical protein